jgi:hypothetical protein
MDDVDDLCWNGPRPHFAEMCRRLEGPRLAERADRLAAQRA